MIRSPSDFIEISFEPEKEVWNLYELGDGSMLRLRTLLLKLFRLVPQPGQPSQLAQYSSSFTNVQNVRNVPAKLKGPPGATAIDMNELVKSPKVELQFTPLSEDWNLYRLEDGDKIKVKLVMTTVYRAKDRWDQFGDPAYLTQSQNVIQPVQRLET